MDDPWFSKCFWLVRVEPEPRPLTVRWWQLRLSGHTTGILRANGICSVERLLELTEPQLWQIHGIGQTRVDEIIEALSANDLFLKD